jgi:hypothetical protein
MYGNQSPDWLSREAKIVDISNQLRRKGKNIPMAISEIPDFPFSTFDSLVDSIRSGEMMIQRFAFEYVTDIFDILADPLERMLFTSYLIIAYGGPIVSIALAIFVSWWCLIGLLSFPIFVTRNKPLYNRVILRSGIRSEPVFCFLYYVKQISIITSDFKTKYYWKLKEDHL